MDKQPLLEHQDLWVPDPTPKRAELPTLSASDAQS